MPRKQCFQYRKDKQRKKRIPAHKSASPLSHPASCQPIPSLSAVTSPLETPECASLLPLETPERASPLSDSPLTLTQYPPAVSVFSAVALPLGWTHQEVDDKQMFCTLSHVPSNTASPMSVSNTLSIHKDLSWVLVMKSS